MNYSIIASASSPHLQAALDTLTLVPLPCHENALQECESSA